MKRPNMLVWLSLSSLSILILTVVIKNYMQFYDLPSKNFLVIIAPINHHRQVNDDDDEDVSASGNVANAKAQDDGDLVASL
jgi:hypothetical protein